CIRPARGGTGPDKMISYEAAPGAKVFIRGSEVVREEYLDGSAVPVNSFNPPGSVSSSSNDYVYIWKYTLTGAMFPDAYNPFALANVPGDWSWLDTSKVDMGPYFRRRGMVFVDGKPLEPVEQYRELVRPPMQRRRSGLPSRNRGGPIMQEIGGSANGKFWVDHTGTLINIRTPTEDTGKSIVEITTREQAFAPKIMGLGYIRVKGITFQHAGNGFPPPQHGLVSTSGGHHWIIEGNTIEWASAMGLDIGGQYWAGQQVPLAGQSHIIRGNTIRYVGVEGLGGMGTQNTLIEDNLIEWVGW
ncbi:MAG: right-handed parallel beta-helix repeat-containing protein, partial [Steroidobacter sp.]